jgi:pimeloyl-ACP methyl ester carboxylesterase
MTDNIIKLKDGRNLGYAEYGDPNGKPLFYFHGWPVSRLHGARVDEVAKTLRIRIIATDRPGIGNSDFQKNRTLLDFPDDIIELADYLKIKKFSVMGVSGGGPYSAVCAYKIPERINKAGIVVGLAPTYIQNICNGMALINKLCWTNYSRIPLLKELASFTINLQYKLGYSLTFSTKSDKSLLTKGVKENIKNDVSEAVKQGLKGITHELKLYTSNWGFDVKNIKIPVYLYYGKDDKNVSLNMGKYYEQQIPNSNLTVYEGGHLSWIEHTEEILKTLVT